MSGLPDLSFERTAQARGLRIVCGVDEAGRGPLAGPVTAAAVVLDADRLPDGINDSKKLTAARRADLAAWLMENCDWCVAHASVEEIDSINILRASHLAMCRAIDGLRQRPDWALIDGNLLPRDMAVQGQPIIRGDALCLSVAAASILAKVARDRVMVDLAQQHPAYGWEVNAGYPTPAHRRALLEHGVTPHHRRSFAPVHNILCRDKKASL